MGMHTNACRDLFVYLPNAAPVTGRNIYRAPTGDLRREDSRSSASDRALTECAGATALSPLHFLCCLPSIIRRIALSKAFLDWIMGDSIGTSVSVFSKLASHLVPCCPLWTSCVLALHCCCIVLYVWVQSCLSMESHGWAFHFQCLTPCTWVPPCFYEPS